MPLYIQFIEIRQQQVIKDETQLHADVTQLDRQTDIQTDSTCHFTYSLLRSDDNKSSRMNPSSTPMSLNCIQTDRQTDRHIQSQTLHASLCSASSHQFSLPRYRLSTYGCQAFSVAGPTVWNSLPEDMRDPQTVTEDIFIFTVLVCSVHEVTMRMSY